MIYCVGLMGTIASGKSTSAHYFQNLGIEVISADKIAKALTEPGKASFDAMIKHLGQDYLMPNGELNRQALRKLIFENETERHWLEQLLHPQIRKNIQTAISKAKGPYCIIEIPLLLDRKDYPYLNRILLVQSTEKQQINRLMQRDSHTLSHAKHILALQKSKNIGSLDIADDVIVNHGSLEDLQQQIAALHQKYLLLAQG